MAAHSKFLPPLAISESSIKRIVSDLVALYLKHRTRISRAIYITLFVALINRIRNAIAEQKAAAKRQAELRRHATGITASDGTTRKKVELNREFFKNLMRLLRIVIPGWKSKELRLLISHSVFLVLRTLISLYVAELDGRLVSSLVRGKGKDFLTGLVWWMMVAVPATFTNSMVSLSMCFPSSQFAKSKALLPSMQISSSISDPINKPYSQQIPLKHDILFPISARRSNKERRSTHHRGRLQVLQQSSGALL